MRPMVAGAALPFIVCIALTFLICRSFAINDGFDPPPVIGPSAVRQTVMDLDLWRGRVQFTELTEPSAPRGALLRSPDPDAWRHYVGPAALPFGPAIQFAGFQQPDAWGRIGYWFVFPTWPLLLLSGVATLTVGATGERAT